MVLLWIQFDLNLVCKTFPISGINAYRKIQFKTRKIQFKTYIHSVNNCELNGNI
jgi:hypothetical protein